MKENTSVEILNDLIRINNDRIEGYEKAEKELKDEDADLKSIFTRMKGESKNYVIELTTMVREQGGEPATGATGAGKLYRTWMDLKATFSGKDRHAILSSCEYGEDAAQRAYEMALSNETLSPDITHSIRAQKAALKTSHDEIKRFRDTTKVTH
jgi:uncharacterized protein (TIGR02284 family)